MTAAQTLGATVSAIGIVAVVATGCSAPPDPYTVPPTGTYTMAPRPEGATDVISTTLPPPVECGDPTASLRPFPPGQVPDSAALEAIRQRGRLIVGLDTGSNLLSFRDPATGEIEGFDVDVAREVARDLLGNPDQVEFRVLNYDEREQALEDGQVDIVAKTMAITCERQQRIDFSTVYYDAYQRILVMAGSPIRGASDLAGRRVCVGESTTSLERVERQQPDAVVVTVPMWSDCLVMLQQNQVDAISTDDTLLLGLATQDPHTRLVGSKMGDERYGIGVAEGNDDLVRFVNGTLDRIRADGTWERIYTRWLSGLGPPPDPPPVTYRD